LVKSQSELEGIAPLPRGRHSLSAEEVAGHQHERLVAAVAAVIAEYSYAGLTVERVIEVAGVSSSTFYVHFENKQEAALAAHSLIFERFMASVDSACAAQSEWPMKVKSAIAATVEFATSRPEQAQILSAGVLAIDPLLAAEIFDSHDRLARALGGLRTDAPAAAQPPEGTEQFLVAAIAAVVARHLANGEAAALRSAEDQLVELTLIPYYGPSEAARFARQAR
jgi:AcrR family transcriptional regulator